MIIIVKTFLVNLLCSIVSCDPDFGLPEIANNGIGLGLVDKRRTSTSDLNNLEWDSDQALELIINTNLGKVEGYTGKSTNGRTIYSFEGIPYAEPPINALRFQPPVKKKPWPGILQAKSIGPYCLQIHATKLLRVIGEESCLTLNIYSPKIPGPGVKSRRHRAQYYNNSSNSSDSSALLPVIVWIHGGAFIFGAGGEYGPAYMLNEDVILVTINYRLGVLGFLSTGDENCSGNQGLKDQAMAIEFIHENIAYFGGDSERIMLMGQSAGGVSVHLHMMSEYKAKDFIFAGVSLSGNAFNHWAVRTPEYAKNLAIKTAKSMGCRDTYNSAQIMKCLRNINPVFLVANQLNLFDWFPFPVVLFSPVIEPASPHAFITASPDELYENSQVGKIPWVSSITSQEAYTALLFTEALLRTDSIKTNWNELAPLVLDYRGTPNEKNITRELANFYFRRGDPNTASLNILSDVASDRYFNFGFHKSLQRHAKLSGAAAPMTYGYFFEYKGKYGLSRNVGISPQEWGIGHVEDLKFFFNSSSFYPGFRDSDESDKELSKIMINLITNFAKTGKPLYKNPESGELEQIWNPVTSPQNISILQFKNHEIQMIQIPYLKRLKFWQQLNLPDMRPYIRI